MRLALLVALALVGCVDGTTPDCSTPASGCYPGDGGSNPTDASDGATDAASSDDGSSEASSDASNDAVTD